MKPFFIVAMPRSGTAWLANFLTYGSSFCYHELSYGCGSMHEIREAFERTEKPVPGTADTAGVIYAHAIPQYFPDARVVIVVRDPREIRASLARIGLERSDTDIRALSLHLYWAIENLNALVVQYSKLFNMNEQRRIWSYLRIPEPFPWKRFEMLREFQVQDYARFVPAGQSDPHMIQQFNQFIQGLPPKMSHARLQ